MLSMSFIFAEYCFRENPMHIQCSNTAEIGCTCIAFPILPVVKEWLNGRCWLVTSGLCSNHTQKWCSEKSYISMAWSASFNYQDIA